LFSYVLILNETVQLNMTACSDCLFCSCH